MSQFKNVLRNFKQAQENATEEALPPSPAPLEVTSEVPKPLPSAAAAKLVELPKKRGRPKGKRSNEEFVQAPAWIRKETHAEVKIALIREGKGQEFSELVETLLSKWLKSKT